MEFLILLGIVIAVIAVTAWVGRRRPGMDDFAVRAHRAARADEGPVKGGGAGPGA
jgi:hypothetical protein